MLEDRKEQHFAARVRAPADYVFATRTGRPIGQRHLLRDYYDDLRHTCASVLVAKGLPVTSVAHQLGHANSSITLKIYAPPVRCCSARGEGGRRA